MSLDGSRQRFTHPLIREALYNECGAAERIALHRRIADALEELYASDVSLHLAELAHHYRQSRDIDKAIDYSIRAGDAAAAKFALREAESCWEDALRLFETEGGDPVRHADLLVRAAILRPGRETQTVERLEQALAIYEKLEMRAKTADVHVRLLTIFGNDPALVDLDRAEAHFRKAESLLVELPVSESLASLYEQWAWLCLWKAQVRLATRSCRAQPRAISSIEYGLDGCAGWDGDGRMPVGERPPQRGFRVAGTRLAGSRRNQR